MVCFCDIPLSQIHNHAEKYQKNGIGLSKKWGINNGLNPVFYIQNNSIAFRHIQRARKNSLKNLKNTSDGKLAIETKNPDLIATVFEMSAYYKIRQGKSFDKKRNDFLRNENGSDFLNTEFYDEKEWRYVPELHSKNSTELISLNFRLKDDFYSEGKFDENKFIDLNNKHTHQSISFEYNDVKYIIVNRMIDVDNMSSFIDSLDNYKPQEKKRLISKLISLDQIKEDF
jgi:hypothetical protein